MAIYYFLFAMWQNLILLTPVSVTCPVVDAGPDLVICEPGQSVRLMGSIQGQYDRFYWEPATGLTPPNSLTPNARVFQTTTYTLVAEAFDPVNIVQNGDFELGVSGFSTDYQYVPDDPARQDELVPEGTYSVGPNPNNYHTGFSPCSPQSGGNMMIVNGSGSLQNIWCQTVPVEPDTEYEIKYWLTSVNPASPAQIQIEINGQTVGPVFSAGAVCAWLNFTVRWNSGGNTTADLCLINRNTALGGNDFAIDNICMNKICREEDEVTIEVIDIQAVANGPYMLTCDDPVIQLTGFGSSEGPGFTYEWRTFNGNIIAGANTLYPTVNRTGTYILTVFGPGGCTKEVAVEVSGNTEPPFVNASALDSLGCGSDSVRLELIVLPANQYYEYDWSGPNNFYSPEERPWVFEPGVYTVIVRDLYGCETIDTVRVNPGGDRPEINPFYNDTLSCAIDSVQLHVEPLDPNQQYQWTGPGGFMSTEPEPWVRDTGWYVLVAGNDPGCLAIDSVFVRADQLAPAPDISGNDINCSMDTARLLARWPEERQADQWRWTDPSGREYSDSLLLSTEAGWHFFTVLYQNGCARTDSILVEIDTLAPDLELEADTITCQTTRAILRGTSMDSTARIEWNGPGNFLSNEWIDTVSLPGWYTGRIVSQNGCTTLDSVEVIRDADVPSIQLIPDTLDCRTDSLALRWNSPDSQLIFRWTGPGQFSDTSANPFIRMPGTYYLELSTRNNCSVSDSVVISMDRALPDIQLAGDSIDCAKDSALIRFFQPDPDVSYEWRDENDQVIGNEASVVVYSGGNYRLTATAPNGCQRDTVITIREDADRPDIQLSGGALDCNTTTLWIRASSQSDSLSYNWSGPGISSINGDSALINSGGNYTVEVVAPNGCRAQAVVRIDQDTLSPDLITRGDTLSCLRFSLTLNAESTNATEWTWSGPNGFSSNLSNPSVSLGGNYQVTVTGDNGCAAFAVVSIEADTLRPSIGTISADTLTCLTTRTTPSVNIQNSQDALYRWTGPGGFNSSIIRPEITEGGSYTLIITNDNGCADTASLSVVENIALPTVDVFGDTLTCNRTQTNLLVVTPNEITASTWVGPGGQTRVGASWVTSMPGWYTATITADNGCQASDSFLVVVDTVPPIAQLTGDTLLYCMKNSALLTASGNPFNSGLRWFDASGSPLGTGDSLTVNEPGIYRVEVTHPRNGCLTSRSWRVNEALPPDDIEFEARPPGCGGTMGSLSISGVSGGRSPIRYSMDGTPVTNLNGSAWAPGTYRLRAIDALGCFTETTVEIPDRVDLQLQLTSEIVILLGDRVKLIPQLNIDTSELSVIRWSPASGLSCTTCFSPWASPGQTTEYTLYIEDNTGCSTQARVRVRIEQPQIFIPNAFTPHNKDGANDYFIPSLGTGLGVKEMAVFDRWGNRMWDQQNLDHTNPSAGWDGTAGGEKMLPGVFVYRIVIILPGGKEKIFVGDITLID